MLDAERMSCPQRPHDRRKDINCSICGFSQCRSTNVIRFKKLTIDEAIGDLELEVPTKTNLNRASQTWALNQLSRHL